MKRALGLYAGGLALLAIGAFPLVWMLSTALKPLGRDLRHAAHADSRTP